MHRTRTRPSPRRLATVCLATLACGEPGREDDTTTGPTSIGPGSLTASSEGSDGTGTTTTPADGTATGSDGSGSSGSSGPGVLFDLAPPGDVPVMPPTCEVVDDMNAVGDCSQTAMGK